MISEAKQGQAWPELGWETNVIQTSNKGERLPSGRSEEVPSETKLGDDHTCFLHDLKLLHTCPITDYSKRHLTLNRVVEISAFKISGSYLVLDEDPEKTLREKKLLINCNNHKLTINKQGLGAGPGISATPVTLVRWEAEAERLQHQVLLGLKGRFKGSLNNLVRSWLTIESERLGEIAPWSSTCQHTQPFLVPVTQRAETDDVLLYGSGFSL